MEKRFIIKCSSCGWIRQSNGTPSDLDDLKEIVNCSSCGKLRQFRCPECHQKATQFRLKGNIE